MKIAKDGMLKVDVTKVMEAKGKKARDDVIEEILYEVMQVCGHSICYKDFLLHKDLATMAWFSRLEKKAGGG